MFACPPRSTTLIPAPTTSYIKYGYTHPFGCPAHCRRSSLFVPTIHEPRTQIGFNPPLPRGNCYTQRLQQMITRSGAERENPPPPQFCAHLLRLVQRPRHHHIGQAKSVPCSLQLALTLSVHLAAKGPEQSDL